MAELKWRVMLVAELHPGVVTETELACIERDERAGLADLGLSLAEAKRLTAALQAQIVPAQMAALSECPRACEACRHRLAAKGHYGARFRSLFGEVPVRVRRLFVCPCRGEGGAKSVAALDFGKDAVAPELAYVTARYAAMAPFGRVAPPSCPSCCRSAGRSTPARCATGRCGSGHKWCSSTPPSSKTGPGHRRRARSWSGWTAATCAAGTGQRGAASR